MENKKGKEKTMQINFTPEQIKAIWDKENRKAWESEMARYEREQARQEKADMKRKYMNMKRLSFRIAINK